MVSEICCCQQGLVDEQFAQISNVLGTLDGTTNTLTISARSLKGKTVLFDCSFSLATHCTTCSYIPPSDPKLAELVRPAKKLGTKGPIKISYPPEINDLEYKCLEVRRAVVISRSVPHLHNPRRIEIWAFSRHPILYVSLPIMCLSSADQLS